MGLKSITVVQCTIRTNICRLPLQSGWHVVDDFQQTMDKFEVPQEEQAKMKAIVGSVRDDIVV
jgi:hypothetical protein